MRLSNTASRALSGVKRLTNYPDRMFRTFLTFDGVVASRTACHNTNPGHVILRKRRGGGRVPLRCEQFRGRPVRI